MSVADTSSGVFTVTQDPGDTRVPSLVKKDQVAYTFLMALWLEGKIDEIPEPAEYGVCAAHAAAFAAEWYTASRNDATLTGHCYAL